MHVHPYGRKHEHKHAHHAPHQGRPGGADHGSPDRMGRTAIIASVTRRWPGWND
jgi:hypothetical protein